MRAAANVILLAGLYLVLVGGHAAGDVLVGLLVAGLVTAAHGRFAPGQSAQRGSVSWLLHLPAFLFAVASMVASGTASVVRAMLGGGARAGGIVEIPFGERSAVGAGVCAFVATLSPDSFLVHVDWERRVMLFHVIDARNPGKIRERYARFYERYQRHVVP